MSTGFWSSDGPFHLTENLERLETYNFLASKKWRPIWLQRKLQTGFLKLRFQISRLRNQAILPLASQQWIYWRSQGSASVKAAGCPFDPAVSSTVQSCIPIWLRGSSNLKRYNWFIAICPISAGKSSLLAGYAVDSFSNCQTVLQVGAQD